MQYSMGSEIADRDKIYYLLSMFGVFLILFFFYIGVPSVDKSVLRFYILFGFILGIVPVMFDLMMRKNTNLPLDTVSYEDNSPIPAFNNIKVQLIASLIIAFIVILAVKVSNTAMVKAPTFHIAFPLLSHFGMSATFINAILSGLTGGFIEVMVFYGFIFPTIYTYLKQQGMGELSAVIISTLLISLIFMTFHFWVYGYLLTDLIKVFIFGILQAILVYTFRSTMPAFALHFANNFAVIVFSLTVYSLQVVV